MRERRSSIKIAVIIPSPASDVKAGNKFRIGIQGDERIGVSKLSTLWQAAMRVSVSSPQTPTIRPTVAAGSEVAHGAIHQVSAAVPDADHQPHDRIAMDSGHAFDAANAISLY